MILEDFFRGIMLQSKKAAGIMVGDRPADLPVRSKPARSVFIGSGEGRGVPPSAPPLSRSDAPGTARLRQAERHDQDHGEGIWPFVAAVNRFFDRFVQRDDDVPAEGPVVTHAGIYDHAGRPATPHLPAESDMCGICVVAKARGQRAAPVTMVATCPGCGGLLGRHRHGACPQVLAEEHGIFEEDWSSEGLRQIGQVDFDAFIRERSRMGGNGGLFV